ncbi:MAG: ribosome-associated translation inhibitor RaiA [Clostridia bacterium]|nr:ribosome-associated translation inhibitor RaiA [Clostridia bacterium]
MKIIILGRQMNVWNDFKLIIEKKLEKLDKYFVEETEATVTLSKKRNLRNVEVTIVSGGTIFRSEVAQDDFRCALDEALETIERQIRKNKTRLSKMLRTAVLEADPAFDLDMNAADYGFDEEEEGYELKVKKFAFKPMTVEEAIMQMELIGHQFFVYNDAETNETCVVYKRHDGYGLIVPDDGADD